MALVPGGGRVEQVLEDNIQASDFAIMRLAKQRFPQLEPSIHLAISAGQLLRQLGRLHITDARDPNPETVLHQWESSIFTLVSQFPFQIAACLPDGRLEFIGDGRLEWITVFQQEIEFRFTQINWLVQFEQIHFLLITQTNFEGQLQVTSITTKWANGQELFPIGVANVGMRPLERHQMRSGLMAEDATEKGWNTNRSTNIGSYPQ